MNAQQQAGLPRPDTRLPAPHAALEPALELIAQRARISTAASGVAISLGDENGMVCRASTGTAPDVGAQLVPEAGLSGYSLRKADIVLCNDTMSDPRVDAFAAQRLGLGSMVVMPVFAFGRLAGLLQVMSSQPHAFDGAKVVRLAHFAQTLSAILERRHDFSAFDIPPEAENSQEQTSVAPPLPRAVFAGQSGESFPPEANRAAQESSLAASEADPSESIAVAVTVSQPRTLDVEAILREEASTADPPPAATAPPSESLALRAVARMVSTLEQVDFRSRTLLIAGVVVIAVVLLATAAFVLRHRARPAPVAIPVTMKVESETPSFTATPSIVTGATTPNTKAPENTAKAGANRSSNTAPISTLQALAGKMKKMKVGDIAGLEKRAAAGDPEARVVLGLAYTQGSLLKKDPAKAIGWYRKAAEQDYAPAEEALGIAYLVGSGVPKSGSQAAHWYTRAAEHGSVMAANELGAMYTSGEAVAQNFADAVKWYRTAAERGDATAEYNLARMYHLKQGVPADSALEFQWLRKAADQGFPPAQYNLALMYQDGKGVKADPATAVRLLRQAAGQGYTLAQTNLGYLYLKGLGVPVDYAQSLKWYRMAAEQGEPMAAYALSVRYLSGGSGVTQDYTEAARWSKVAADKGHPDAQYNLGLLYASGKGVTRDLVAACKWLALSGEPGSADQIHSLQKEMTPAQISAAQSSINQWRSTQR